jgi:hypothetical protein
VAAAAPEPNRFFVRMSAGFGVSELNIDRESETTEARVPGLALDFSIGVLAWRRLALGGIMQIDTGSIDLRDSDPFFESGAGASVSTFGASAAVFPFAETGLNVGTAFGYSLLRVSLDDGGTESVGADGVGGALWVGYDAKILDEWSIGSVLRASAGRLSDGDDFVITRSGLAVLFTAVYE